MLRKLKENLCTRETITYIIVGVVTTGINILCYDLFCNRLHLENLLANAAAWLISIIFAFVANDRIVFKDTERKNSLLMRVVQFFIARMASLLVDEIGMFLLVDFMNLDNMYSKIFMNIIIIVMNYGLSKKIIFR